MITARKYNIPNYTMTKNEADSSFKRSISKWTLFFADEKEEAEYQLIMRNSQRLPPAAMYWVYFGIFMHLLYRIIAIISSFVKTGFSCAPAYIESILFATIASAVVIEVSLKRYKLLPKLQGSLLYTTFPVVLVTAAFYTRMTPYFGVAYNIVRQ